MAKKEAPKSYDKMYGSEVPAPETAPAKKVTKPRRVKMKTTKLVNFRKDPGGEILKSLPAGTEVWAETNPVIHVVEWRKAELMPKPSLNASDDDACGYIMAEFLEKV